MKKIGFYSLLVAAMIFSGCSEKTTEIDVANGGNSMGDENSEVLLNTLPGANIDEVVMEEDGMGLSENKENGVYYMINGRKVFIENIYFGFDKYSLNSEMKEKAMSNASKLSALTSASTVKVEGNTDEWGTDEYNYALGLKRAKAVKDVLVSNGVSANVTLVSYGESNPVCTEKTKSCWQKNRRVNHTLVK